MAMPHRPAHRPEPGAPRDVGGSRERLRYAPREPAQPRAEPRGPVPPRARWRDEGPVVAAVAVGGAVGATARYGVALLWPTGGTGFPWPTLAVNVTGCALIGVLMVLVSEVWVAHRLVRPLCGTGLLGGFTTFSTYAVDGQRLLAAGRVPVGLAYLALTVVAALAAVWAGAAVTRRAAAAGRRRGRM